MTTTVSGRHPITGDINYKSCYVKGRNRGEVLSEVKQRELGGWTLLGEIVDLSSNPERHWWKAVMVKKKVEDIGDGS